MPLSADERVRRARTREANQARDRTAAQLKLNGATFQQIADQLGLPARSTAQDCVNRGLGSIEVPDLERARDIQQRRLESIWMTWYPRAIGTHQPGAEPDPVAAHICVTIHDRISKLLRLDREPTVDMEEELRRVARAEGWDEDAYVKEAMGIVAIDSKRWRRTA